MANFATSFLFLLAARIGVRPPTVTKTINRLQAQGFLEKRGSETDARQAHVFLTESGRDMIRAIERSVRKTEKQAFRGLDKKEQKMLARLLSRVEANFGEGPTAEATPAGQDAGDGETADAAV